jgi:hypothetical protein
LEKLDDYSGSFNQDLKPTDFSHAALEKLIKTYASLYKALDGFWYLAVMERSGDKEALDLDIAVWEKLAGYEIKKITKAFNITGRDVESLMKAFQLTPWAWNLKSEFELIDKNCCIWKVRHCPTVDALEREGRGREDEQCNNIEVRINEAYAKGFNPDIKVTRLTTPPRKNKSDYYCTWEFKI